VSEPRPTTNATVDLSDPAHYINRELSLLEFERRVLAQARDPSMPLLERLRFLAICSTNLDEFFEIRVAGLKQQAAAGVSPTGPDGLTPQEALTRIAGTNVFVSNCPGNRGLGHDQVSVSARASRPCRKAGAKHTRRGNRGEAPGVRSRVPGKGKDLGRAAFQSRMTPCAAFENTATSFRTWIPASAGFFVTPLTFSSSCCSYTACNIGGLQCLKTLSR